MIWRLISTHEKQREAAKQRGEDRWKTFTSRRGRGLKRAAARAWRGFVAGSARVRRGISAGLARGLIFFVLRVASRRIAFDSNIAMAVL